MEYTFTMTVTASGDFTDREILEYLRFTCEASCSIPVGNPFMTENGAEVTSCDLYPA